MMFDAQNLQNLSHILQFLIRGKGGKLHVVMVDMFPEYESVCAVCCCCSPSPLCVSTETCGLNSQTVRTVPPISYRGIQSSQSLRERGEAAWVRAEGGEGRSGNKGWRWGWGG